MSAVRIEVQPTADDILSAYWGDIWGRLIWPLSSGILFAALMMLTTPWDGSLEHLAAFGGSAVMFSAGLTIWFLVLSWFGGQRVVKLPGVDDRVAYAIDETGVELRSQRQSTKADWTFWQRAYETSRVFVLCAPMNAFYVIPKNQTQGSDVAALRLILGAGLAGRVRFKLEGNK